MELQLKPEEAELLIAVMKYAEDVAEDHHDVAMERAIADLRAVRSVLLQTWLRSKLAAAGLSPDPKEPAKL